MKIGILTIGNELTSGRTQDTNSSFIARQLNIHGWQISVMMSVGDDGEAIKVAIDHELSLSDAVIITGGLGPTADDITTAAIAGAFGLKLYTDESALAHIKDRFDRLHLEWTANNVKQAVFPEGAETIRNPAGMALGFFLRRNGKVIVVMPGVPSEAQKMLPEGVIPVLKREFNEAVVHVESRTVKLFGIPEARVDQMLSDIDFNGLGVSIGFYPNFPEIQIALTARCTAEHEAREKVKRAEEQVTDRLRPYIFAYDQETLEGLVAGLLIEKKLTLALAESCTGGLIADRLTDIPGSSAFFERGVIAYSNRSKTDILGVPQDVIDTFGAVSERVAGLMAEGVRTLGKTDLGMATTGIAGPTGGTEGKPVGTVYVALADGKNIRCRHYAFRWDRRRIKSISSQVALMMLKKYLTGEREDG
ncbi:MAG: competence/damage-inducible protein A [Deltaproteobacteria bacterium]|nr:competence/damage-inducible protein A [Deltaproteobacteria bacterium]